MSQPPLLHKVMLMLMRSGSSTLNQRLSRDRSEHVSKRFLCKCKDSVHRQSDPTKPYTPDHRLASRMSCIARSLNSDFSNEPIAGSGQGSTHIEQCNREYQKCPSFPRCPGKVKVSNTASSAAVGSRQSSETLVSISG
jgi:hypothetical protein